MNSRQLFRQFPSYRFIFAGIIICLSYAVFSLLHVQQWALSADEFVFARHIFDYSRYVPYRDFAPYKSTIGYYLLVLPFFIAKSVLGPLFLIKKEIILLNTASLGLVCWFSATLFHQRGILLSLAAIIANAGFIMYAADLRVDMLTSWCCLFALLAILHHRTRSAGLLFGIAFLISQKALWYLAAANAAWLICCMAFPQSFYSLRQLARMNFYAALPVIIYIVIWSTVSSVNTVLSSLFYEAYVQAGINWYEPIYFACWNTVMHYGPCLFLLWPLTFLSLNQTVAPYPAAQQRVFILSLSSCFLLLFIHYKQAFPYNFVFTVPAFYLLYAEFFSWLQTSQPAPKRLRARTAILFSVLFFLIINILALPLAYNLIVLLPFVMHRITSRSKNIYHTLLYAILLVCLIILPLTTTISKSEINSGRYQQQMIGLVENLLGPNDNYLAGLPYFYQKDQPIDGLKNLIGPELDYIYQAKPALKPLLLDSLYLTATDQQHILDELKQQPVKVIMNNYRLHYLPEKLRDYIDENYTRLNGSVYIYAPLIHAAQREFNLPFAGEYKLQSTDKNIQIDGKQARAGSSVRLAKGQHRFYASHDVQLIPVIKQSLAGLQPQQNDKWLSMLKAILS